MQVRTVLQHAWAELAHDRAYKFSSQLPAKLQRKLNLYSGMLEVVDRGFDEVSNEVDLYASKVGDSDLSEVLNDFIDSINIEKFISDVRRNKKIQIQDVSVDSRFFDELYAFGIETVSDLLDLFDDEFIEKFKSIGDEDTNTYGIIRDAMMYKDINSYFEVAWPLNKWGATNHAGFNLLASKYGDLVLKLFKKYEIDVLDED